MESIPHATLQECQNRLKLFKMFKRVKTKFQHDLFRLSFLG